MRKLLIAMAVVIVIIVGVLFFAVANLNAWLEANRDTLAGMASDAVGREVRFERAEVAFSSGLAVRVAGLRIAEDPRFGEPDFLALEDAYVGVRILPALQRRVEVSGIRLVAPTIRVIQTKEGFNFSTIASGGDPPAEAKEESEEAASFAVAIAALEIEGGTVYYEDRASADGLSLVIESLETSGTDLALEGPIALDFAGVVRSLKAADVGLASRIEGDVALESLSPVAGTVKLRSPRLHPAIFGVRLEEGDAVERIDELEVDATLTPDPDKSGYPVAVRASAARLSGFELDDIAIDVLYRPTKAGAAVDLDRVSLGVAGGRVDVTGDVVLGQPGASPFDLETKLRDLDTGKLATALLGMPEGALSGTLGGDVALSGRSLEWESLKRSLAGKLRLEVGEGALEQVNVLNTLVSRLTTDPGIGQLAASSIRDVMPEALEGDRTPFEGIDMALEILDGAVQVRDVSIDAGDFGLQAIGRVGLDGDVAANGTVRFSERVSKRILQKADSLAPLLGEGDVVTLPLTLGGTTAEPSIMPDLAALAGKAQKELQARAAREIGDAIFGKRREEGEEGDADDADRDSTEALIEKGLGRLLGR
jgi:hypothetical protein